MRQALLLVVFSLGLFSPLLAQELRPQGGGESYGSGANFMVIPAVAFRPVNNLIQYSVTNGYVLNGDTGIDTYQAAVELPAGANVVNVCGLTLDNNPSFEAHVTFEAVETGDGAATPKLIELASGVNDTPGYHQTCVDLASPILIRKYADLDGDGQSHFVWYQVTIYSVTGFGGAEITWLRTVSPAPASATFADVPTNFLYFRAIEALAVSGITSGCGGGNFCPNGTVTRGEMAAFLARALGLHWPL